MELNIVNGYVEVKSSTGVCYSAECHPDDIYKKLNQQLNMNSFKILNTLSKIYSLIQDISLLDEIEVDIQKRMKKIEDEYPFIREELIKQKKI